MRRGKDKGPGVQLCVRPFELIRIHSQLTQDWLLGVYASPSLPYHCIGACYNLHHHHPIDSQRILLSKRQSYQAEYHTADAAISTRELRTSVGVCVFKTERQPWVLVVCEPITLILHNGREEFGIPILHKHRIAIYVSRQCFSSTAQHSPFVVDTKAAKAHFRGVVFTPSGVLTPPNEKQNTHICSARRRKVTVPRWNVQLAR